MKKITFLLLMLITSFGFSQTIVIQDFEPPATYTGLSGDDGTVSTIVSSPGGVSGNSLRLESTTGPSTENFQAGYFDQVSDFVVLTPENNTVQVDVYSTQAFNLRLKLELGAAAIERTVSYTTPNTWQTLTYDFGAVTATYSRIVFFLNSNDTNDGFLTSQNFTAFMDNITTTESTIATAPTSPGPTPTQSPSNVISVYGDTYPSITTDHDPNWGQSGHNNVNPNFGVGSGQYVLHYPNFNYQGTLITTTDASNMEFLHVDIWTNAAPGASTIQVSPINNDLGSAEILITINHVQGGWYSVDIPKSDFSGMTWDSVYQMKFAANGPGSSVPIDIYLDNVYFWRPGAQFVYENGAWSPSQPDGVSTSSDNILVINGTATIDNGILEANNLEVQAGAILNVGPSAVLDLAGDIINNGEIVFKSDITSGQYSSGQLAEFNRNILGNGEITSERFIPAGEDGGNRASRYLSSSVTTTESIFENWQEGGFSPLGFGTHITGVQGNVTDGFDNATGLDYTQTGNPSMFGYNNSLGTWEEVENTNLQNTSGPAVQIVLQDFDASSGLSNIGDAAYQYVSDPNTPSDPGLGNVALLRSAPGGQPFQGVNVTLFEPVDLTSDKTMQIQVYSENTISIILEVNQGIAGAPDSATSLTINGSTSWQTLTATFNQSLDNTDPADGVYENLVIRYFWNTAINNFPIPTPGPAEQIFYVNEISGYPVASSTLVGNLEAGVPYAILIRGDRNTDLTTNTPPTSNTVLRAKGALQTGSVTETFTQSDSFVLVGNPYQSVVDLDEIDYTGVRDDEFYVWDPRLGDNDNGAYVTVTTGTGISDPSGSDANEFLQPGQAVFMLTEPTGPHSIIFRESDKATGVPQTEVFSTTNIPYLNMRLYTTARFNAGGKEHDAMGLRFHDENTIHQFRNARKLGNSAETMAFLVGDDFASIQHAVLEADENQFPIYLGSYQHQEYTFWFQLENLPEGVTAYLKDDYTEELTELQQGVNSIAFTVDAAIQGSISTNRFSIAFDIESLSNEDFEESAFEFYPNPTDATLSINLGSYQATNTKVKIYDVTGRLLMQTNFTTNESIIQIDMSQLNTGLYFVEVAEGNQKFTSKVLKR